MDVLLDRDRLRDARDTLALAKTAFTDASSINDSLEEAIGDPHGKSKLRDRVGWFEANWSGNRDELLKMVENVHTALSSIVDSWDSWEAEATASLDNAGSESGTP